MGALNEKVEDGSSPQDWAYCGAIGFGWDMVVWDEAVGREAKVQCSPSLEHKQRAKLARGLLWFHYEASLGAIKPIRNGNTKIKMSTYCVV